MKIKAKNQTPISTDLRTQIASVATRLSMLAIPENALLHGVVLLMKEYTAFRDADHTLGEEIYQGSVFEDILGEWDLADEKLQSGANNKVLDQLKVLAEYVDTDYVLITKI
jgi:hypothetical protein